MREKIETKYVSRMTPEQRARFVIEVEEDECDSCTDDEWEEDSDGEGYDDNTDDEEDEER